MKFIKIYGRESQTKERAPGFSLRSISITQGSDLVRGTYIVGFKIPDSHDNPKVKSNRAIYSFPLLQNNKGLDLGLVNYVFNHSLRSGMGNLVIVYFDFWRKQSKMRANWQSFMATIWHSHKAFHLSANCNKDVQTLNNWLDYMTLPLSAPSTTRNS